MIDWPHVVYNALWIVGCAVILAGFSVANWLAHVYDVRTRRLLGGPAFQLTFYAGLGLVGFLSMLFIVVWVAVKAYRSYDPVKEGTLRAVAIGGLSGMVATLAHGLVDSHTWGSKGAFILWLVMGLLVALYSLALPRSSDLANIEG